MTALPITHMTLYKHGVGFFERRAQLQGEEVRLSFRVEEMNDILKSLTALDLGPGQVLGIDYATPQSLEERLAGCSIRLSDGRSLRDLLIGLRGRRVRLIFDQDDDHTGTLLGIDELPERQPLANSLVSLLLDRASSTGPGNQVLTVNLGRVRGVEILDVQGASDLRFFLETALGQENYRQVTVRLTPGEHDLVVSYIAPAPTWRVSYRLVLDPKADEGPRALLLGWGIFDNQLEEDLKNISLSLVAGMPISFVYDLYTPFTPERPVVEEEHRVAAAPVEFAQALPAAMPVPAPGKGAGVGMAAMMAPPQTERSMTKDMAMLGVTREALAEATPVAVEGEELGELFQYVIATPVTVGRGQSAMVPIVSCDLGYRKDLLYNAVKLPTHPVATLRLDNASTLTLERGPVTVLESSEYVGEAILPFTVAGGELVVPYAVELAVKVREQTSSAREMHRLHIKGAYLHFEEWDIRKREYQLNNTTSEPVKVLVEHPRSPLYDLFRTPEPVERTDEHLRFEIEVPERGEAKLKVQERRLITRREELRKQSYKALQQYLRQGLIERGSHDQVTELLKLWDEVAENEKALARIEKDREKVYQAQQQIQGNMGALSKTGQEGNMRARYVRKLQDTEEQLEELARREAALKAGIERLQHEIGDKIKALE